jgi:hypothetical protein
LKIAGHDAVHVAEIGLTSADDRVIPGWTREQDRVLHRLSLETGGSRSCHSERNP